MSRENGHLQMCCSYLPMCAATGHAERKTDEGQMHMFTHTPTHLPCCHVHTCLLAVEAYMTGK